MKNVLVILILCSFITSCSTGRYSQREQYDDGFMTVQSYEIRYREGKGAVFIMNYIDSKDIECSIPVLDTTKYLRGQKVQWPVKM